MSILELVSELQLFIYVVLMKEFTEKSFLNLRKNLSWESIYAILIKHKKSFNVAI